VSLDGYVGRFQSLHCDQHEGRPRPHKAVMLLATGIIAPGPATVGNYDDLRWFVRKGLDGEIEGQREVLQLADKTVIMPRDVRLRPKREAVERRMAMLEEAC